MAGLAMGRQPFKNELRELMYIFGLGKGWLGCKSQAEKSILHIGLILGWLRFKNELRDIMYRFGLAEAGWVATQRQRSRIHQLGWLPFKIELRDWM